MSTDALACITCGRKLRNVTDDADNQPSDGIAFNSHGHYGSTVFDPMDGTYLEFNICDPCVKTAGEWGRVLVGRDRRPVVVHGMGIVGWERIDRPLIPWNEKLAGFDESDTCYIDEDELDRLPKTVTLNFTPDEIRTMIANGNYLRNLP